MIRFKVDFEKDFEGIYMAWTEWKYSVKLKLFLQDNTHHNEMFNLILPFGHVAILLKDQVLIHTLLKSKPDYKYWIEQTVEIDTGNNCKVSGEDSWILNANILHFASRFFPEALHTILSFFEKEGTKDQLIQDTHQPGMNSPLHCAAIHPESIGTRYENHMPKQIIPKSLVQMQSLHRNYN